MKNSLYVLVLALVFFTSCTDRDRPVNNANLTGSDYRLFQNTPVWELAKLVWDEDSEKIKDEIFKKKVDPNFQEPKFGKTLLMLAVKHGSLVSCKALLEAGAKLDLHDTFDGSSALIDACDYNSKSTHDLDIMKLLLDNGANPNDEEVGHRIGRNTRRDTPLLNASGESVEKVELLLKYGAKVNYRNEFGETPLGRAYLLGKYEIVLLLLNKGADYNVPIIEREGKPFKLSDMLKELDVAKSSDAYEKKMAILQFLNAKD